MGDIFLNVTRSMCHSSIEIAQIPKMVLMSKFYEFLCRCSFLFRRKEVIDHFIPSSSLPTLHASKHIHDTSQSLWGQTAL